MIPTTNDNSELHTVGYCSRGCCHGRNCALRCAFRCGCWHFHVGEKVTNGTKATILLEMYNDLMSQTYFCRLAIPHTKCGPSCSHSSRTNRRRERNNCVCRFSGRSRTCIQDCLSLWCRGRCVNMCAIARFNSLLGCMYASWCTVGSRVVRQ